MTVEEGALPVGSTDIYLDTTIVNQTDGNPVHREVVVLGDPETLAAYGKVTNAEPASTDYGMVVRPFSEQDFWLAVASGSIPGSIG